MSFLGPTFTGSESVIFSISTCERTFTETRRNVEACSKPALPQTEIQQ